MPHRDLKILIEQGKVMLPAEHSSDMTTSVLDNDTKLLSMSLMNTVTDRLYPVLGNVAVSNPNMSMNVTVDLSQAVTSNAQQTKNAVSEVPTDTLSSTTIQPRKSYPPRYQDLPQLTKNPLQCPSPIHEEPAEEDNLVKSAPLLAVDDGRLEFLTTTLSNLSTLSHESANFTYPYHPIDNPLLVAQHYTPQRSSEAFNATSYPSTPFVIHQDPQTKEDFCMMAPTQPSNLSSFKPHHHHPTYKRLSSSGEDIPPGRAIESLLSQPRHFSYNKPNVLTNCSLRNCNKPTQSSDISTCICPRCGPFSIVRYCSIAHLHADIRRHYIEDCTRRPNMLALIAIGTLEPFNRPVRSFIAAKNIDHDSLERHRQAILRSYPTDIPVDYSIFNDADLLVAGEGEDFVPSPALMRKYRGHGRVVATIAMYNRSVVKAQFAATLEQLLTLGVSAGRIAPEKCRLLFSWIKAHFEPLGQWDENMMNRIALAMQLEFGYKVPLSSF